MSFRKLGASRTFDLSIKIHFTAGKTLHMKILCSIFSQTWSLTGKIKTEKLEANLMIVIKLLS